MGRVLGFALFAAVIAPSVQSAVQGENPKPVQLVRPSIGPLSAMAQLGRRVFFDPRLSSSGRLSCASRHSPQHAYGPPGDQPVLRGGPTLSRQGLRAVPSLMYLERQPNFTIGPENDENENASLIQAATASRSARRKQKTARTTAPTADNLVPQGGLFWDGRADTLQSQALVPLLNRWRSTAAASPGRGEITTRTLRAVVPAMFGSSVFQFARVLVTEALFAVARSV